MQLKQENTEEGYKVVHISQVVHIVNFTLSILQEKQQFLKWFHVMLELLRIVLLAR